MKEQINKNLFNNTKLAYITKSNKDLLKSFIIFWILNNKFFSNIGTILLKIFLKLKFPIKSIVKKTIFNQFCGGETLHECDKIISSLSKYKVYAMPDYSVEGEISEEGFENNMNKTINIITSISKIKLPFYRMGQITSYELLGIDEIIIFCFYLKMANFFSKAFRIVNIINKAIYKFKNLKCPKTPLTVNLSDNKSGEFSLL